MQPSEVEGMPYYEYEYLVEDLLEILKEKKEAEEKASSSSGGGDQPSVTRAMGDARRAAQAAMPKFPGVPSSIRLPR